MTKLKREPGYIDKFLKTKRRCKTQSAGTSLFHLRETELDPELALRLAPFIAAYAPHSRAPHDYELREAGYVRITRDSFTDELNEAYFETHGYYPEDNPDLQNQK